MTGRIEPDWSFLFQKLEGCYDRALVSKRIYRDSLYFIYPEQSDYKKMSEVGDKYADLVQELEILQGPLIKL